MKQQKKEITQREHTSIHLVCRSLWETYVQYSFRGHYALSCVHYITGERKRAKTINISHKIDAFEANAVTITTSTLGLGQITTILTRKYTRRSNLLKPSIQELNNSTKRRAHALDLSLWQQSNELLKRFVKCHLSCIHWALKELLAEWALSTESWTYMNTLWNRCISPSYANHAWCLWCFFFVVKHAITLYAIV